MSMSECEGVKLLCVGMNNVANKRENDCSASKYVR